MWDNLPHDEIISKEIKSLRKEYKKYNNIDDLEIGLDSDSDSE